MQKIRFLDKLVDELAKGKAVHKVLRGEPDPSGVGRIAPSTA